MRFGLQEYESAARAVRLAELCKPKQAKQVVGWFIACTLLVSMNNNLLGSNLLLILAGKLHEYFYYSISLTSLNLLCSLLGGFGLLLTGVIASSDVPDVWSLSPSELCCLLWLFCDGTIPKIKKQAIKDNIIISSPYIVMCTLYRYLTFLQYRGGEKKRIWARIKMNHGQDAHTFLNIKPILTCFISVT